MAQLCPWRQRAAGSNLQVQVAGFRCTPGSAGVPNQRDTCYYDNGSPLFVKGANATADLQVRQGRRGQIGKLLCLSISMSRSVQAHC